MSSRSQRIRTRVGQADPPRSRPPRRSIRIANASHGRSVLSPPGLSVATARSTRVTRSSLSQPSNVEISLHAKVLDFLETRFVSSASDPVIRQREFGLAVSALKVSAFDQSSWSLDPRLQSALSTALDLNTSLFGNAINHSIAPFYSHFGGLQPSHPFGGRLAQDLLSSSSELNFFANPPYEESSIRMLIDHLCERRSNNLSMTGIVVLNESMARFWTRSCPSDLSTVLGYFIADTKLFVSDSQIARGQVTPSLTHKSPLFVYLISFGSNPSEKISSSLRVLLQFQRFRSSDFDSHRNLSPILSPMAVQIPSGLSLPTTTTPVAPVIGVGVPEASEREIDLDSGVQAEDVIATEICTTTPPSGVVAVSDQELAPDVADGAVSNVGVVNGGDNVSRDQAIPLQVYVLAKEGQTRWHYCLEVYGPSWFPPMKHIMCTGSSMTLTQVYILAIGHVSFLLSQSSLLPNDSIWELRMHFPGPHVHQGKLDRLISWWLNPEIALCPGNSTPKGMTLSLINRLKGLNSFQEKHWIRLYSQKVFPFSHTTRGTEGLWFFNRWFGFGRSDSVQLLGTDSHFTAYKLHKGNGFHYQFNKPLAQGGWAIPSDASWSSKQMPSGPTNLQDLWPKIVKLRMMGLSTVRKFGARQSRLLNQCWLELFSSIAKASTNEAWLRLLCFAPLVLFAKQNIGLRLHLWKEQQFCALFDLASTHLNRVLRLRASQKDFDNVSRCELQIANGRYSAAWSNLGSDGAISYPDKTLYEALQALHPEETSPPPSLPTSIPVLLDSQEVTTSVWKTKSGSAPGISGLRIDHIKACFFVKGFSTTFTEVLNLVVSGQLPDWASSVFAGAKLIALHKPSGGIRPIALTESIRRLASKAICLKYKEHFGELVGPHQYGVGVSSGIEKALGYSRFCWSKSDREVMLQIDAKNAFNSVFRSTFFEALKISEDPVLTSITQYINQMYGSASVLHNDLGDPILAQRGVAQGDNLSPFLFALAIKPVLTSISNLGVDIISFLDDITLIGSIDNVCRAWNSIQLLLHEIGLSVNLSKCKLYPKPEVDKARLVDLFVGVEICEQGVRMLGVPFGSQDFKTKYLEDYRSNLSSDLSLLSNLPSLQHRFLLLYFCWCRRPHYLLRCMSPEYMDLFVSELNEVLFSELQSWWGLSLSADQRTQLMLPIRLGGMGLGVHPGICRPAYLCGTLAAALDAHLEDSDLEAFLAPIVELHHELARFIPTSVLPDDPLTNLPAAGLTQNSLCKVVYQKELDALRREAPVRMECLVDFSHAGDWLISTPYAFESWLDNSSWLSACKLRLGIFPSVEGICPICTESLLDNSGQHHFNCPKLKKLITLRHSACVHSLVSIFSAASLEVQAEQRGFRYLVPHKSTNTTGDARPDHLVWCFGTDSNAKYLATDVTVINPKRDPSKEMASAAAVKIKNYRDNIVGKENGPLRGLTSEMIRFEPLVANVYGGWNKSACTVLQDTAKICTARSGRFTQSALFSRWAWRKLSVAFQRATAEFFDSFLYTQLSKSVGPCRSGLSIPFGSGLPLGSAALDIQLLNLQGSGD